MNPFDLRGPAFLVFYLFLAAVVAAVMYRARRNAESGPGGVRLDLSDPYLIAALRGGTVDVLRVAVISLVDRGLIKASDNKIRYPQSNRGESVTHPVERVVLDYFATSDDPAKLLADPGAREAAATYEDRLRSLGYLPDYAATSRRL